MICVEVGNVFFSFTWICKSICEDWYIEKWDKKSAEKWTTTILLNIKISLTGRNKTPLRGKYIRTFYRLVQPKKNLHGVCVRVIIKTRAMEKKQEDQTSIILKKDVKKDEHAMMSFTIFLMLWIASFIKTISLQINDPFRCDQHLSIEVRDRKTTSSQGMVSPISWSNPNSSSARWRRHWNWGWVRNEIGTMYLLLFSPT